MKTILRISGTLAVVAITLLLAYVCFEGASTSSGHTIDERRTSLTWFFIVLAAGLERLLLSGCPGRNDLIGFFYFFFLDEKETITPWRDKAIRQPPLTPESLTEWPAHILALR
jgi:hypothetical protein